MGVTGLWDIVARAGRRVKPDTLEGRVIAVDASIWLIQFIKAMRAKDGGMIRAAHVIGFFRRICKLMYYRVRPVFVFDGPPPALKRQTLAKRRRARQEQEVNIAKAAEKLLANLLRQHIASTTASLRRADTTAPKTTPSVGEEATAESSPDVEESLTRNDQEDPPGQGPASAVNENDSSMPVLNSEDIAAVIDVEAQAAIAVDGPESLSDEAQRASLFREDDDQVVADEGLLNAAEKRAGRNAYYTSIPDEFRGFLSERRRLDDINISSSILSMPQSQSALNKNLSSARSRLEAKALMSTAPMRENASTPNRDESFGDDDDDRNMGIGESERGEGTPPSTRRKVFQTADEFKEYRFNGTTVQLPLDADINPEVFEQLPAKLQYQILQQLRDAWFNESRLKAIEAKDNMDVFSEVQVESYMRTIRTQRELTKVKKTMALEVDKSNPLASSPSAPITAQHSPGLRNKQYYINGAVDVETSGPSRGPQFTEPAGQPPTPAGSSQDVLALKDASAPTTLEEMILKMHREQTNFAASKANAGRGALQSTNRPRGRGRGRGKRAWIPPGSYAPLGPVRHKGREDIDSRERLNPFQIWGAGEYATQEGPSQAPLAWGNSIRSNSLSTDDGPLWFDGTSTADDEDDFPLNLSDGPAPSISAMGLDRVTSLLQCESDDDEDWGGAEFVPFKKRDLPPPLMQADREPVRPDQGTTTVGFVSPTMPTATYPGEPTPNSAERMVPAHRDKMENHETQSSDLSPFVVKKVRLTRRPSPPGSGVKRRTASDTTVRLKGNHQSEVSVDNPAAPPSVIDATAFPTPTATAEAIGGEGKGTIASGNQVFPKVPLTVLCPGEEKQVPLGGIERTRGFSCTQSTVASVNQSKDDVDSQHLFPSFRVNASSIVSSTEIDLPAHLPERKPSDVYLDADMRMDMNEIPSEGRFEPFTNKVRQLREVVEVRNLPIKAHHTLRHVESIMPDKDTAASSEHKPTSFSNEKLSEPEQQTGQSEGVDTAPQQLNLTALIDTTTSRGELGFQTPQAGKSEKKQVNGKDETTPAADMVKVNHDELKNESLLSGGVKRTTPAQSTVLNGTGNKSLEVIENEVNHIPETTHNVNETSSVATRLDSSSELGVDSLMQLDELWNSFEKSALQPTKQVNEETQTAIVTLSGSTGLSREPHHLDLSYQAARDQPPQSEAPNHIMPDNLLTQWKGDLFNDIFAPRSLVETSQRPSPPENVLDEIEMEFEADSQAQHEMKQSEARRAAREFAAKAMKTAGEEDLQQVRIRQEVNFIDQHEEMINLDEEPCSSSSTFTATQLIAGDLVESWRGDIFNDAFSQDFPASPRPSLAPRNPDLVRSDYSSSLKYQGHPDKNRDENIEQHSVESGPSFVDIEAITAQLEEENLAIREQLQTHQRGLDHVTPEMQEEVRDLLRAFGIPFVDAPAEAEAQASFLTAAGLCDGVISDDSDTIVFGAREVYRHFFDSRSTVEEYDIDMIYREIGVGKAEMILLAMLLGCDYTLGVKGIGVVNALETIKAFGSMDEMSKFKSWANHLNTFGGEAADDNDNALQKVYKIQHRNYKLHWVFPENFPSAEVFEAFDQPVVDRSMEPFSWSPPDIPSIVRILTKLSGIEPHKIMEDLDPVINRMRSTPPVRQQRLLSYVTSVSSDERVAEIKSKRMLAALETLKKMNDCTPTSPSPKSQKAVALTEGELKVVHGAERQARPRKSPQGKKRAPKRGVLG
eukprot:GHVN01067096.1.p1 GENE.GHVN01067096.1~~GHVN01067096.1.p1  ORF type:complete len:1726 (+),score=299.51 GHVN01067096.1:2841-8018(+)